MKLESAVSEIESSGVISSTAFSIAMNAKAFKALSSTIYQNKQGSIVRELCCNAYDSHVMAGHPEKPFQVHLPDDFEPWFSVKDFGVGLSDSDIKSVFSTFFESSKDQSNDVIGAFGLGAKTPFSYTDQFTVTSIVNGVKCIYSAFIGPGGFPEISKMHEENTNEPNGVEINMAVKREDFSRFANEVRDQLRFFKTKPQVNVTRWWSGWCDMTVESVFTSCEFYGSSEFSDHYIVQGQVGYPLNAASLTNASDDVIQFLKQVIASGKRIVINMPIGTIGVTISRESIEFDTKTIDNIEAVIKKIIDEVAFETKKLLDSIDGEFNKAQWLNNNKPLGYRNLMEQYCPNVTGNHYYYRSSVYNCVFVNYGVNRSRNHYGNPGVSIIDYNTHFIVADVKTMLVKRTEKITEDNRHKGYGKVWTIEARRADGVPMQQSDYETIVKEICDQIPGFKNVYLASSVVVQKTKNPTKYASAQYYLCTGSYDTTSWKKKYEGVDDLEDEYTYVVVDRMRLVQFSRDYDLVNQYIQASQFMSIRPLIAIRKIDEKKVAKMKNMQPLHEYMVDLGKDQPFDVRDQKLYRLFQLQTVMGSCDKVFFIEQSKAKLNPDSAFAKFFAIKDKIAAKLVNVSSVDLNNKAAYYGWKIPTAEVQRIRDRWQKMLDKVPLVRHTYNSDLSEHLVDYINAMKV